MRAVIVDSGDIAIDAKIANALRDVQIDAGRGALLLRPDRAGERRHLLEKIIFAAPLPEDGRPVDYPLVPWKQDPVIILMGGDVSILDEFEQLVPGLKDVLGEPVRVGAA